MIFIINCYGQIADIDNFVYYSNGPFPEKIDKLNNDFYVKMLSVPGSVDNFPFFAIVSPSDGLRLRSEYNLSSNIIRTLPQYTKVLVIRQTSLKENINGINDYWYYVDTGSESGWVFGAYLTKTTSQIQEKPTYWDKHSRFLVISNTLILDTNKAFYDGYYPHDTFKIYEKPNKQSNYSEIMKNEGWFLFALPETEDWFYIFNTISDGGNIKYDNKSGYVYIYDLSINKGDNNIFGENAVKIGRYGPLLEIRCKNGKYLKFWDSFTWRGDRLAIQYLLDLYEERNEVHVSKHYIFDSWIKVFSLLTGDILSETKIKLGQEGE